jgi:hypothetical protein
MLLVVGADEKNLPLPEGAEITAKNTYVLFDYQLTSQGVTNDGKYFYFSGNKHLAKADMETGEILPQEPVKQSTSPVYRQYLEIQEQYPNHVIAYRLGDFYEIFGDNAKQIADKLDLTLTGRDCGLKERIPMIGFPYHCADNYINKILEFASVVIFENNEETVKEKHITNVDYETGEVFDLTEEEMREFDGDIYEPTVEEDDDDLLKTTKSLDKDILYKLYDILGNDFTIE